MEPIYAALVGRATVALAGHSHNYQRFKPNRGITPLVVGTGGRASDAVNESDARLAAVNDTQFGALRLRLGDQRLDYEFISTSGARLDSGTIGCERGAAPAPAPPMPPPSPSPTNDPASARIARPADNRTYTPRLSRFSGTSANAATRVRVTPVRGGRPCRWFDGRRFVKRSCATRRSLAASGLSAWRFDLPTARALPRGRYRLTARVRGRDGRSASDTVRFAVR